MRTRQVTAVAVAVAVSVASCSDKGRRSLPPTSTSPSPSLTTRGTTSSTTTGSLTPAGQVVFSVGDVALAVGQWLSVALHPTEVPIDVAVTSTAQLEVCPANLDGTLNRVDWPGRNFTSCLPLGGGGGIQIPSTHTHDTHVAFALRARTPGVIRTATINYRQGDHFLQVTPPAGEGDGTVVSFTPSSRTVGAQPFLLPDYGSAPSVRVVLDQLGHAINTMGPCSFPAELTSCFTGVKPDRPVGVTLHGNPPNGDAVALYLEWSP